MVRFSTTLLIACLAANVCLGGTIHSPDVSELIMSSDSLDSDSLLTEQATLGASQDGLSSTDSFGASNNSIFNGNPDMVGIGDSPAVTFTPYQEIERSAETQTAQDESSRALSESNAPEIQTPTSPAAPMNFSDRIAVDTTTLVPEPSSLVTFLLAALAFVAILRQPRQR